MRPEMPKMRTTNQIYSAPQKGQIPVARGRLKRPAMNRTEAAYANHLELLKQAGEVLWYRF